MLASGEHSEAAERINATGSTTLRDLAEVIGSEATVRLIDAFGGLDRIYIPKSPSVAHRFTSVLTPEEWKALVRHFRGERMSLPRGVTRNTKALVYEAHKEGLSNRAIATRLRLTERHVRRTLQLLGLTQGRTVPKVRRALAPSGLGRGLEGP